MVKYYTAFSGELKCVYFVREQINEYGSTNYVMRNSDGSQFVCSPDMYKPTPEEAWQEYLRQCEQYLPDVEKALKEAKKNLAFCKSEIDRVRKLVTR